MKKFEPFNAIRIACFCFLCLFTNPFHAQKSNASPVEDKGKILFVVSNARFHGDSEIHTANHFSEIVIPYDEFKKQGYNIDFVSPMGGQIPIGYINYSYGVIEEYLYDSEFMSKLQKTLKPSEVIASKYKAIFYAGGGAAMYGVPENESIQQIAMSIYEQENGVVASICHGAAGLVNLKLENGDFLVKDKKVNGFPDIFENKKAPYYQSFPFSIEETIKARGGDFQYSKEGWDRFYQVDGRLITAQDPTGGAIIVEKIIEVLTNN